MKLFIVEFNDWEGSFFVSAWSTPEKAEAACNRLNSKTPHEDRYCWTEDELDPPYGEGEGV